MNILVSNDDGINSKALKTLVKELSDIGNIFVVAPDSERSTNSHHFTTSGRMRVEEKTVEGAKKAYALWGTPSDCIHCGIEFLVKEEIDLVVSGINKGWNTTADAIYSGTVAAAREAFIMGKKSIAFSLNTFEDRDYNESAKIAKKIIIKYLQSNNPDYFLNVNIPDVPVGEVKGIKVCDKIGPIAYFEDYSFEEEFGVTYVKIGKPKLTRNYDINDYDIDTVALDNGYITIVPLFNDEINHKYIKNLKDFWE